MSRGLEINGESSSNAGPREDLKVSINLKLPTTGYPSKASTAHWSSHLCLCFLYTVCSNVIFRLCRWRSKFFERALSRCTHIIALRDAWKLCRSFEIKKKSLLLFPMHRAPTSEGWRTNYSFINDSSNTRYAPSGINKRCLKVPVNLKSRTSEHPSAFRHTLQKRFQRISCYLPLREGEALSHIFHSQINTDVQQYIFNHLLKYIFQLIIYLSICRYIRNGFNSFIFKHRKSYIFLA